MLFFGRLIGFVFSRTGLVFSVAIGLIALIAGLYLLNANRLGWKTSSDYYRQRAGKLKTDSARYVGRIDTLNRQAEAATKYAYHYKQKLDSAIAVSDVLTGRLTDEQKKTAYLRALVANRTLPPFAPGNAPAVDNPAVVEAGLKTANREAISRAALDTLSVSIGRRDAQIKRLAASQRRTISRVDSLGRLATAKGRKGGVWPFNRRRRKEEQQLGGRASQISAEAESDLEKELNQP